MFSDDTSPMKGRISHFLIFLQFTLTVNMVGESAFAMELSDLPALPDEYKVQRKPAIVDLQYPNDADNSINELKKDINQNVENLETTTKVLKEMGVINPNCADCDSLTNKKVRGRSPALELNP